MVELENTFYNVSDDMDVVEVCAVIRMACDCYDSCDCLLTFPLNVSLTVKGIVIVFILATLSYKLKYI